MGLNDTPISSRTQIGFFGCTNAGKSSLVNAITAQNMAIVSPKKGTTTDPVIKTMELLPLGPVAIIDTPGLDDEGDLGELRIKKTYEMLDRVDIAVIVIDAADGEDADSMAVITDTINECKKRGVPFLTAVNKVDINPAVNALIKSDTFGSEIAFVSAETKEGIDGLKELIARLGERVKKTREKEGRMVSDIILPGDTVILVIPIDDSAPKGRLILPQQQVIRDVLEVGGNALCIKDTELKPLFDENPSWKNKDQNTESSNVPGSSRGQSKTDPSVCIDRFRPALVITDSQVFKIVDEIVPESIPLTSFSIIMARYKGTLKSQIEGARIIDTLKDGDTVLVAEGCTHHRQCEDIGTVKLPRLLRKYTGKEINIETSSGGEYPEDLSKYALILHCGGCMLNEKQMKSRMRYAQDQYIPITNYGIAIAYMNGILKRSIEPIKDKI